MDRQAILLQARQAGVKLVRFLYCGNDGLIRGKAAAIEALDGALEAGIGLTVAMQSFTMLDRLAPKAPLAPWARSVWCRTLAPLRSSLMRRRAPVCWSICCSLITHRGRSAHVS